MESTSTIEALTGKFQAHKQSQFTGVVHVGVSKAPQWSIYFHLGRMVWAHARSHPIRRWHRQIVKHCPQLVTAVTHTAADGTDLIDYAALHYSKLVGKVRKGEVSRIDIAKAVEDYLSEILFDIVHQGVLHKLQTKPDFTLTDSIKEFSSNLFLVVRAEQAWQQAQYDWQSWQLAELVKCSPNLAPVIGQADALKQKTSAAVYQHLISSIDGQHTFRDLSVQLDQPLLPLTRRIVSYIRQGVMGVTRVDDLGSPNATATTPKLSTVTTSHPSSTQAPLRQAMTAKVTSVPTSPVQPASVRSTSSHAASQSSPTQPGTEPIQAQPLRLANTTTS